MMHIVNPHRKRMESSMILNPHTSVYIVNNTAVRYGGGILADEEYSKGHYCFFQTGYLNYTQMDTRVVMEGNTAGKAEDIFRKLQKDYIQTPFSKMCCICY